MKQFNPPHFHHHNQEQLNIDVPVQEKFTVFVTTGIPATIEESFSFTDTAEYEEVMKQEKRPIAYILNKHGEQVQDTFQKYDGMSSIEAQVSKLRAKFK